MKKIILYLLNVISILPFTVFAQVENGDFESWNAINYTDPTGWECGNHQTIDHMGLIPVTQVNGLIGSGVRMETMVTASDTAEAYIANGDPMSATGGIPCNQMPTTFNGYYRYNLPNNDSAIFLIIFKNGGNVISQNIFKIHGTGSQNTFTAFAFPLSLSSMPDSVIIAAASSNLIDNVGVEAGSWLELDNLLFAGTSVTIPNSTFDNWTPEIYETLSSWTIGGNAVKSIDSHNGNFAIELATYDYGGGISPSFISDGQDSQNGFIGGVPYTTMTDTLVGWYKYIPANGNDSAGIGVQLFKNGGNVGGYGMNLPAANTYTYFEVPINAWTSPDTIRIDISSSKWPVSPSYVGSTLILDDLEFKSQFTLGVKKVDGTAKKEVYPNPATDIVNFNLQKQVSGAVDITIYDVAGRKVKFETYKNTESSLIMNLADLNSGIYFYSILGQNYSSKGKFTMN